jgi:hypothetical protein
MDDPRASHEPSHTKQHEQISCGLRFVLVRVMRDRFGWGNAALRNMRIPGI